MNTDFHQARRFHLAPPGSELLALPWGMALPARTAKAVVTESFALGIERRLVELQPELLRHVADALLAWWPLRPKRTTGLELVLVQANGSRDKLLLHPRLIRIGRDASAHVQLAANTVSREHCEIRVEDDKLWLVDLDSTSGTWVNGYRLESFTRRALVAGDQVDVHPFRLIVGRHDVLMAEPFVKLEPRSARVFEGEALPQLGAAEDLWVRASANGVVVWTRLPGGWLGHAYRALGYPPPASHELGAHNPVDLALTSFLLQRVATTLGERLATPVEVSPPLPSASARALAAADAGVGGTPVWHGSTFALDLSGISYEVAAIWPATAAAPGGTRVTVATQSWRRHWLAAVPFACSVELGRLALPVSDLGRVEVGDIVLPDSWLAAGWPARPPGSRRDVGDGSVVAGAPTAALGKVRLRLQSWTREAQLEAHPGAMAQATAGVAADAVGGNRQTRLALVVVSPWTVSPRGAAMGHSANPQGPQAAADALASLRVPDELEAELSFELDRITVPLGELVTWQTGSTVLLERSAEDPIRIVLHQAGGPRLIGRGRVVLVDGQLGVQIEQWLVDVAG